MAGKLNTIKGGNGNALGSGVLELRRLRVFENWKIVTVAGFVHVRVIVCGAVGPACIHARLKVGYAGLTDLLGRSTK